jgi:hypothetical protein
MPLAQIQAKPTDLVFWKGLMGLKQDFFNRGLFILGNGALTHFWEDA